MSSIISDSVTGEFVIISQERGNRPHDIESDNEPLCPFCAGNEHMTPKEILTSSENIDLFPDSYWCVRDFENKYPALTKNSEQGFGVHEVIVDIPLHNVDLHNFNIYHLTEVLNVIKNRIIEIEKDNRIKYVQVFKNVGRKAGASQSHSHWQIVGLPFIPDRQLKITKNLNSDLCPYCEMLQNEFKYKERIVEQTEFFTAFTPYASKFSYEICITPNEHISNISLMNSDEIFSLAYILKNTLSALNNVLSNVSYNICLLGSANNDISRAYNHWNLQIIPRLATLAGFEFATGCFINEIAPENAAKSLRNHRITI